MMASKTDIKSTLALLESQDLAVSEQISATYKQEINSANDGGLFVVLFDHYCHNESSRALDILINVRDTREKVLLDKVCESMRAYPTQCITLLSHVVQRQPSWLQKIRTHPVVNALNKTLKTSSQAPVVVSGLLLLSSLLPHIPVLSQQNVADIMAVFLHGAVMAHNTDTHVYSIHLKVAVYCLFNRLYGMYPKNLIAFLRREITIAQHHPEQMAVFDETVLPLLHHVRFHPLLLTTRGNNSDEYSLQRWYRKEPHDIVAECAKLSLDPSEDSTLNQTMASTALVDVAGTDGGHLANDHHSFQNGGCWSDYQSTVLLLGGAPGSTVATNDGENDGNFLGVRPSSALQSCKVTPMTMPRTYGDCSEEAVYSDVTAGNDDGSSHIYPVMISLPAIKTAAPLATAGPTNTGTVSPAFTGGGSSFVDNAAEDNQGFYDFNSGPPVFWSPSDEVGLSTPPQSRSNSPHTSGFAAQAIETRTRYSSGSQVVRRSPSVHEKTGAPRTPDRQKSERSSRRFSDSFKGRTSSLGSSSLAKLLHIEKQQTSTNASPSSQMFSKPDGLHDTVGTSAVGPGVAGRPVSSETTQSTRRRTPVGGGSSLIVVPVASSDELVSCEIAEEANEDGDVQIVRGSVEANQSVASATTPDVVPLNASNLVMSPRPGGINLQQLPNYIRKLSQENVLDMSTETDNEVLKIISHNDITGSMEHKLVSSSTSGRDSGATSASAELSVSGASGSRNTLTKCLSLLDNENEEHDEEGGKGTFVPESIPPIQLCLELPSPFEDIEATQEDSGLVGRKESIVSELKSLGGKSPWVPPAHRRHVHSVGSMSALSPCSTTARPRLTNSTSVAEYMTKLNRIRFDSQSQQYSPGGDGMIANTGVYSSRDSFMAGVGLVDSLYSGGDLDGCDGTAEGTGQGNDIATNSETEDFRPRSESCPTGVKRPNIVGRSRAPDSATCQIPVSPINRAGLTVVAGRKPPSSLTGGYESSNSDCADFIAKESTRSDASGKLRVEVNTMVGGRMVLGGPKSADSTIASQHVHQNEMPTGISQSLIDQSAVEMIMNPEKWPYLRVLQMAMPKYAKPSADRTDSDESCDVVKSPFDALDHYLECSSELYQMLSGDSNPEKTEENIADAKELRLLKVRLKLMHQQLLYERYKRQMHSQRSRRIFSRLKQHILLEEQNNALMDQMRLQEEQVNFFVGATEHLRKENKKTADDFSRQESELKWQNQLVLQELDHVKALNEELTRNLDELQKNHKKLNDDAGKTKHALLNAGMELDWMKEQVMEAASQKTQMENLQTKLLIASEINKQLRDLANLPKPDVLLQESYARYQETARREISDLKRSLRKEHANVEAMTHRICALEENVALKKSEINELKRSIEDTRAGHKDYVLATEVKYNALMAVSQRSEGHVLELYRTLEHAEESFEQNIKNLKCQIQNQWSSTALFEHPDSFTTPPERLGKDPAESLSNSRNAFSDPGTQVSHNASPPTTRGKPTQLNSASLSHPPSFGSRGSVCSPLSPAGTACADAFGSADLVNEVKFDSNPDSIRGTRIIMDNLPSQPREIPAPTKLQLNSHQQQQRHDDEGSVFWSGDNQNLNSPQTSDLFLPVLFPERTTSNRPPVSFQQHSQHQHNRGDHAAIQIGGQRGSVGSATGPPDRHPVLTKAGGGMPTGVGPPHRKGLLSSSVVSGRRSTGSHSGASAAAGSSAFDFSLHR